MFENAQPIPVVTSPSVEDFNALFVRREQPVVVRGALADWAPSHKWTPEYLKTASGSRRVKVGVSKTGEYVNYADKLNLRPDPELTLGEVVDGIFAPQEGAEKRRVHQEPLEQWSTLNDESPPLGFIPREVIAKNIWMGSAGNLTKAHYDTEDNINVQLRGRKEFILYPAEQLDALYPHKPWEYMSNFAQVDLASPDLERFPRFRHATPMRAVLEPGDFLYIPLYWWHQVHTLEASLNVNFWWQIRPDQAMRRHGIRYWPRMARDGYLQTHLLRTARGALKGLVGGA